MASSPSEVRYGYKQTKKCMLRWTPAMINYLITCLGNYRTLMEYKGKDFDGDRRAQYTVLREEMAKMFGAELFGPESRTTMSLSQINSLSEEQRKEEKNRMRIQEFNIKRGYNRVLEKVKDIRQRFSKAILQGSTTGSGKIIIEHFERLKAIYGGSPSATKLDSGVETDQINPLKGSLVFSDNEEGPEPIPLNQNMPLSCDDTESSSSSNASFSDESKIKDSSPSKRKASTPLSKLVDNKRKRLKKKHLKRKHLEKKLSASQQRDEVLLREARDDAELRRDLIQAMTRCNESFAEAMKDVGESMRLLTQTMLSSFQALAATLAPAISHHSHQGQLRNMYQQQPPMMQYFNAPNVQNPVSSNNKSRATPTNMTSGEEQD